MSDIPLKISFSYSQIREEVNRIAKKEHPEEFNTFDKDDFKTIEPLFYPSELNFAAWFVDGIRRHKKHPNICCNEFKRQYDHRVIQCSVSDTGDITISVISYRCSICSEKFSRIERSEELMDIIGFDREERD